MPVVERMDFPQKRPLKMVLVMLAIIGAAFGIWYQNHTQDSLAKNIIITNPAILQTTTSYIEIEYDLENRLKQDKDIRLLAIVFDSAGEELASSIFMVTARAGKKAHRSWIIDKLNRSLKEGETPSSVHLSIFRRRAI
ncbi:MAG: hypothetical protein PHI68_04225 [Candidatus Cloacimonetes bacterium]|nr:hypothetical protein [Candidatus Cloacimonadota bacterium]